MLKLDKIKNFKIWIIIGSFFVILWKAIGYGKDKEKLKQYKNDEKINKKVDTICKRKFNVNKLRKLFHRKGK